MSCEIFISYRKSDTANEVTWLCEELGKRLPYEVEYFRDEESIASGDLWEQSIVTNLEDCRIVIAVIGNDWLGKDKWGRCRLNESDDWVRKEIELALKNKKTIFPVLINDAEMPPPDVLPETIRKIWDYQYRKIRSLDEDESGIERLCNDIQHKIEKANIPDPIRLSLQKTLTGKYEVKDLIGEGPNTKVYLAYDTVLDRKVAIRAVKDPKNNESFIKKVQDAAKTVKNIPHYVQVHHACLNKDPLYVVMGYLDGESLRKELRQNTLLPLKEIHQLLKEVGNALVKLHKAGKTYCNIKPSNILLSSNNDPFLSPLCRLQGLNQAYVFETMFQEERSQNDAAFREDLCYLAPELFDRGYAGESENDRYEKIDQYMLGLLGYELLTGTIPNTISTLDELKQKGAEAFANLEKFGAIRKDCPRKLAEIILRMTNRKPGKRYPTLEEAVVEISNVSFDPIEIAKDSYSRCLSNRVDSVDFIKAFYDEFLRISDEAKERFSNTDEGRFQRQYDMLREAIFILFMFAERKTGDVEPNVLTRIAKTHDKHHLDISGQAYDEFIVALTNTVCGVPAGKKPYDPLCENGDDETERIKDARERALADGIEYMKRRYWPRKEKEKPLSVPQE